MLKSDKFCLVFIQESLPTESLVSVLKKQNDFGCSLAEVNSHYEDHQVTPSPVHPGRFARQTCPQLTAAEKKVGGQTVFDQSSSSVLP